MQLLNHVSLSSFAFKHGCSYIGGFPKTSVLDGLNSVFVFMFKPEHFGNTFFMWVRSNFDSNHYQEKELVYKNKIYKAVFVSVPQFVSKKFLFSFRNFQNHKNLIQI